jgi:hypothetical protein
MSTIRKQRHGPLDFASPTDHPPPPRSPLVRGVAPRTRPPGTAALSTAWRDRSSRCHYGPAAETPAPKPCRLHVRTAGLWRNRYPLACSGASAPWRRRRMDAAPPAGLTAGRRRPGGRQRSIGSFMACSRRPVTLEMNRRGPETPAVSYVSAVSQAHRNSSPISIAPRPTSPRTSLLHDQVTGWVTQPEWLARS